MSEITRGVIGMPLKLAMSSDLSRRQFHACAQSLLVELEAYQQGAKTEADAGDEARREVRKLKTELKKRERFGEYWKQRAKSAEGHLFASDFKAAAAALHKASNYADIPYDELSGSQRAHIDHGVAAVIVAINARRAVRRPQDNDTTVSMHTQNLTRQASTENQLGETP